MWNKGQGCCYWLVCHNGDHPPAADWRMVRTATADDGTPIQVPPHFTDMMFENICWQAHTEGTCGLGPGSEHECHRFHACTPWSPNSFRVQEDLHDLRPDEVTSITMRPKVNRMPQGTWLMPHSWMNMYDLSMRHCKNHDELMRWRPIQDESIMPPAYDNGPLPGNFFPVAARARQARARSGHRTPRRRSRPRSQPQGQPVGEPHAASSETGLAAAPCTCRKAPPPPPPTDMAPLPTAPLQLPTAPLQLVRKAPPPPPPNGMAPSGPGRGRNKVVRFSAESGNVMPGARRSKTPGSPCCFRLLVRAKRQTLITHSCQNASRARTHRKTLT